MNAELLRELARIARSSELHDLRVGLTPDETDALANMLEREHEEAEKFRALEARAVTNGTLKVVINDTIMGLGAARKGVRDERPS